MKKKIRLLAVCAIMLCGMIVGGIAKPAEVMAKQTIKATREMKDAPKIQLDKLYHIAANDSPQAGKADILAWNSHEWNYYDFVTVKLTEKTNLTLFAQETGGSDGFIRSGCILYQFRCKGMDLCSCQRRNKRIYSCGWGKYQQRRQTGVGSFFRIELF